MERTKSLWICPFWDQIYCWNTKNLLEIKMFANTVPLGISNNVGARSQKNHRNRVKLSKKKGSQIGSKLPPWGCAKASSGILISKYLPSILSWCQVSASGYLLFSILTRRNNCFFGSCRWVWGHYSSKQRQIELKFWPWGFFIVVQMLFKAFWKFLQRQDVPKIRVFGPTLTPIYFNLTLDLFLKVTSVVKLFFVIKWSWIIIAILIIFYVSFSRYLNFWRFGKPTNFNICDVINIVTQWKLHLCLFLLNPIYYQNQI